MRTEKSNIDKQSEVKDIRDLHFDEPPKTMYKYTSFKRTFDVLMNNKIYFAKFSDFNDPFEGLTSLNLDTCEGRKAFTKYLEKNAPEYGKSMNIEYNQKLVDNPSEANILARNIVNSWQKDSTGFCCLTDTCQSLPMWAHYADNHAGCCLVFDFSKYSDQKLQKDRFPFHYMKKIEYQENLPKYNMDGPSHDYSYKSREWEYEHEWRAIMFDKTVSRNFNSFLGRKSNGSGLYPLGDFLYGVILGYKMKDDHKKSIKVAARQRGIYVQQASPELYKYGMRLTEIDNGRLNQE